MKSEEINVFLILVFLRLMMCTAITLAQSSKEVNPLRTETAKIMGSSRGDKGHKKCSDVFSPTEFGGQIGEDWVSWVIGKLRWWQW